MAVSFAAARHEGQLTGSQNDEAVDSSRPGADIRCPDLAALKLPLLGQSRSTWFLLRHGRRYPGKTNWTKSRERWIAEQRFEHDGDRIALAEYQLAA